MTKRKSGNAGGRTKSASRKREAKSDPECADTAPPTVRIAAAPMKIGESRDHLQQRSKWFSARSGKKS